MISFFRDPSPECFRCIIILIGDQTPIGSQLCPKRSNWISDQERLYPVFESAVNGFSLDIDCVETLQKILCINVRNYKEDSVNFRGNFYEFPLCYVLCDFSACHTTAQFYLFPFRCNCFWSNPNKFRAESQSPPVCIGF